MILALDHIVILVNDLESAVGDYEALGFTVTPGGEHSDGATHNALISFADGSYLELIAFKTEAPHHRWWQHRAQGEGLIDYALLPANTAGSVAAARSRGLSVHGPFAGGRARPDGVELEWQTAYAETPELPFLCGDVTSRELRVPQGPAQRHVNSVVGIYRITIGVHDLEASAARFGALIGQSPMREPERRLFKLGSTYIALQAPEADLPERAAVRARIEQRGDGIAALALRRETLVATPHALDAELTHGARITIS